MITLSSHWYLTWPPLQFSGVVIAAALLFGTLMSVHLLLCTQQRVAPWRCMALCAVACCAGVVVPGVLHFFDTVPSCLPSRAGLALLVDVLIRLAMPAAALCACATLLWHTSSHQHLPRAAWFWPAASAASGFAYTIVLLVILQCGRLSNITHTGWSMDARGYAAAAVVIVLCVVAAAAGLYVHLRTIAHHSTMCACMVWTLCAAVLAVLLYVFSAVTGAHNSVLSTGGVALDVWSAVAVGMVVYTALAVAPQLLPAREHPCVCCIWASLCAGVSFGVVYLLCVVSVVSTR